MPRMLTFEKVATVPEAQAQPTLWGSCLQGLTWHDGAVWGGYGDWNVNSGPIRPWRYDTALTVFEYAASTECLSKMTSIGGKLYAPHIDPRTSDADLSVWNGTTWSRVILPGRALHVFDVQQDPATGDIVVVGGDWRDSVGIPSWKSADGGATWAPLTVLPVTGRCYFLVSDGASLWCSINGVAYRYAPTGWVVDPAPSIRWFADLGNVSYHRGHTFTTNLLQSGDYGFIFIDQTQVKTGRNSFLSGYAVTHEPGPTGPTWMFTNAGNGAEVHYLTTHETYDSAAPIKGRGPFEKKRSNIGTVGSIASACVGGGKLWVGDMLGGLWAASI